MTNNKTEANLEEFKIALDTCKQLLTLATGVLTVTITFLRDVVKPGDATNIEWLTRGWVLCLVSVIGGVVMLLGITGSIAKPTNPPRSIYDPNVRWPSMVQVFAFAGAMVCLLQFGRTTF